MNLTSRSSFPNAQAPTATVSAGVRYFGRGPISEEEDRPRCGGSRFMARLARCHLRPGYSGRRRTASARHEIDNRRFHGGGVRMHCVVSLVPGEDSGDSHHEQDAGEANCKLHHNVVGGVARPALASRSTETIVRWHRAGFRAYNETRTHLEASSAGKSG